MNNTVAVAARIFVLVMVTLALGWARVLGIRDEAFQAIAHLWIGGLIGGKVAGGSCLLAWLAGLLSALELACFLFLKG